MHETRTLQLPGRGKVHLLGTCHLSPASAMAAAAAVSRHAPRAVLLELCAERAESVLSNTVPPAPLPALTAIYAREHWRELLNPLFWIKLPFLGAEALVGTVEGFEFTAAAEAAKRQGAEVLLIDRPVGATLTRIALSLRSLTLSQWVNFICLAPLE